MTAIRRRISVRKLLAAAFGAMILLLAAGELVARFGLGLGSPPLYVADPQIEYMMLPDQDVRRFGNRVIVNHYGMRSEAFPVRKPAGEFRVMVFGDSVVNGGSQTDHAQLATSLVQQGLRQAGLHATVGNISAGSWGPGNWLAYARRYGFFDADAVVLVVSSGDYADNPLFEPLDPDTHPSQRPLLALGEGITRYLPRFIPWLHAPSGEVDHFEPVADESAARIGLQALHEFLDAARQRVPMVIVLQHWERAEIQRGSAGPGNARILDAAAELGLRTVSLQPWFQRAVDSGQDPYRDNIHPNALGQRLIADAILAQLPATP